MYEAMRGSSRDLLLANILIPASRLGKCVEQKHGRHLPDMRLLGDEFGHETLTLFTFQHDHLDTLPL